MVDALRHEAASVAAAAHHSTRDEAVDPGRRAGPCRKAPAGAYRRKATWRHVSTEITKAAQGEKDLPEICVSLRLVLALEGVECLMK